MRKTASLASLGALSLTFAVGLIISGAASAKPLAPLPPLSDIGRQMLAAEPGKVPENPCPDAESVGIPIYPHSYCVAVSRPTSPDDKILPTIVLVTKRAPRDVRAWYARHLGGAWQYNHVINAFVHPGWILYRMTQEPAVRVVKATQDNIGFFGINYDLTGMRTKISIYHHFPKSSSKASVIAIDRDGHDITNKTISAVVGERVALEGRAKINGATASRPRWKIGGKPIGDWQANNQSAHIVSLTPAAYTKPAITFYWWSGGTYDVRYQVHAEGRVFRAEVTFKVKRPDIQLTAATPSGLYGVLKIKGGRQGSLPHSRKGVDYVGNLVYAGNGHTIVFSRSKLPPGFDGTTEFVQLTKLDGLVHKGSTALYPHCQEEHDKAYVLDTDYPYGATNKVNTVNRKTVYDAPGRDVFTYTKELDLKMQFKMYLMFKPNLPGAIYVPISYVPWWWTGRLSYNPERQRKLRVGEDPDYKYYLQHTTVLVRRSRHPRSRRANGYPEWDSVTPSSMPECKKQ